MLATSKLPPKGGQVPFLMRWLFTPLVGIHGKEWLRLIARHGLTIPWQYWPRALFTSFASLVNTAIGTWERRRYADALEHVTICAPVFVIGHHRSGTTHLWNLLATNPRFAYPNVLQAVFPHTFLTVESAVNRIARHATPKRRPQDNMPLEPDSPIEEERAICAMTLLSMQMGRHFPHARTRYRRYLTMADAPLHERQVWQHALDRFARKLTLKQALPHAEAGDTTLLFKSPDHTGKIDLILAQYPDAQFIHIHRHPYAVFQSTRRMELTTQPVYAYQRQDPATVDDFILWRYRAMYDAFFQHCPSIPTGQYVEVRYDDLVAAPLTELARVYRALGWSDFTTARAPLERYLGEIADYRTTPFPALDTATRERIHTACQPCFDAWNYAA